MKNKNAFNHGTTHTKMNAKTNANPVIVIANENEKIYINIGILGGFH